MSQDISQDVGVFNVTIMDKLVKVKCPKDKIVSLQQAAAYLDQRMQNLHKNENCFDVERLAVLAALNITYELMKQEQENLRELQEVKQLHRQQEQQAQKDFECQLQELHQNFERQKQELQRSFAQQEQKLQQQIAQQEQKNLQQQHIYAENERKNAQYLINVICELKNKIGKVLVGT